MRQSLVLLQSFPVLSENARAIQKCAGAVQTVPLDRGPIGGFNHMVERGKLNHSLFIGFLALKTPQEVCVLVLKIAQWYACVKSADGRLSQKREGIIRPCHP